MGTDRTDAQPSQLDHLRTAADGTALAPHIAALERAVQRAGRLAHGDLARWQAALAALPPVPRTAPEIGDVVAVGPPDIEAALTARVTDALEILKPWRKGPFRVCGIGVDAEWRSNLKWDRLTGRIGPLDGRTVLDVGSGNGYFGWRMLAAGARIVVGLDPNPRFVMQHELLRHFAPGFPNFVLPLRLEDAPASMNAFDTVFSLGVIYHRRSPDEHLDQLRAAARPGAELVLESLVLPDDAARRYGGLLVPESRYARMRNVWAVPAVGLLRQWIERAGFTAVRLLDVSRTTLDEQRRTSWIDSQSLADFLDPADPTRTVEGYPAPTRAVLSARAPERRRAGAAGGGL